MEGLTPIMSKKQQNTPHLVFLHGLLGDKNDWQKVIEKLPHFSCYTIDLPCHGEAQSISCDNFDQICTYLAEQIQQQIKQPYYLVGYSLGGRIALHYSLDWLIHNPQPTVLQGLILEGANLGLSTEQEKQQRWQNDLHWATNFEQEDIQNVLQNWYQQAVFASLSPVQQQAFIMQRRHNQGTQIARMLKATSLAKQLDFREKVRSTSLPIYYFCGEQDQKFRQMAEQEKLDLTLISHAGHNAHWDNPQEFADKLQQKLFLQR